MAINFTVAWLRENYPGTRDEVTRQWITAADAMDVYEDTIRSYGVNGMYLILIRCVKCF